MQMRRGFAATFLFLFYLVPHFLQAGAAPLMFDDWAWLWTYFVEGAANLFDYHVQMAHVGYYPVIASTFAIPPPWGLILNHLLALFCNALNAYLLFRFLYDRVKFSTLAAAFVGFIFLFSPFYNGRTYVSATPYDLSLTFFLLSLLWGDHLLPKYRGTSYLFQIFYFFGLETLVFLEPLRLLTGQKPKRYLPHFCIAFVLIGIRALFIKTSGFYKGYNDISLSFENLAHTYKGFKYFYAEAARVFMSEVHITSALFAGAFVFIFWGFKSANENKKILGFFVCLFTILLSILPYALAGRWPSYWGFESRLTFVVNIPVFLLLGVLISTIPLRQIQIIFFAIIVGMSCFTDYEKVKWVLYDQIVVRAYYAQLDRRLPENLESPILLRTLTPVYENQRLYMRRSMGWYDASVAINMMKNYSDPKIFVFPGSERPEKCHITTNDLYPCPKKEYQLKLEFKPEWNNYKSLTWAKLIQMTFLKFDPDEVLSAHIVPEILLHTDALPSQLRGTILKALKL